MSSATLIFIFTVLISIIIASLLSYFTNLSATAKVDTDKKVRKIKELLAAEGFEDYSLKNTIYEKLGAIADSKESREKIAQTVASVFDSELKKRVETGIRKQGEKYEKIIEERGKNEEIAWTKYKKAVSDKEETDAVIRSIAEGLVVVDAQGRVVMMNPAAEKLLGVSKKDKIGKPVMEEVREEQLFSLVKGAPNKGSREIELVSSQSETKRVLRASSAVIESEDGKTVGMVSVLNDITKQKELDAMKSKFVANVSHELRTPLVAIEKSIDLILAGTAGQVSQTQDRLLVIAENNLKRLSVLINDLLDLSKLESGKVELKRAPASIKKLIDETVDSLSSWANTKSLKIEKKAPGDLPDINIDADRITQVLLNLIGNSIKFTPKDGTITIEASLSENSDEMLVSIRDTGIGIAKENLPKLFSKFYQVGERVSSDVSGTGIGLSIAKEIVELHSGRICVESEKGQGANFILMLPVK